MLTLHSALSAGSQQKLCRRRLCQCRRAMTHTVYCNLSYVLLYIAQFWRLTFTVKDIVTRKHDPTAHDVSLIAAGPKGVPHSTPMEDLAIICKKGKIKIKSNLVHNKEVEGKTHTTEQQIFLGVPVSAPKPPQQYYDSSKPNGDKMQTSPEGWHLNCSSSATSSPVP